MKVEDSGLFQDVEVSQNSGQVSRLALAEQQKELNGDPFNS